MRMRFLLIITLFIFSSVCANNQESFLKANALYEEKKYKYALESYDAIDKRGLAVWYNMGNAAYKMGDYTHAILYWRRAQKNSSYKIIQDAMQNISAAYKKLGYEKDRPSLSFLKKHISVMTLFLLQILFLLFWFVFFIAVFYLKKQRMIILPILFLGNFLLATFLIAKYRSIWYQKGFVIEKKVDVFTGPDQNYHTITSLRAADEFKILKKQKKWYKIKYNKFTGWVLADKIEII